MQEFFGHVPQLIGVHAGTIMIIFELLFVFLK